MNKFQEELKGNIEGSVHFDPISRRVYSVDASIFEVEPQVIIIPNSKKDLQKALEIAHYFKVPVTARGAATGITGGCLGRGAIIDLSKSLNKLIEINQEHQYAICEPGLIQDELNHQLSTYGLRLGPDTSTGNRATLGGMLANNAAGSRSLHYGKMVDAVEEVEIALANGELLHLSPLTEPEWQVKLCLASKEGDIYREVERIRRTYRQEIIKRFPNIPRRVSGYNLDELIKPYPLNLAKLIAGSEGTLGIATQIKMTVVPKIQASSLCLIFFDDLLDALKQVPELLIHKPVALELIDDQIIELGRASPSLRGQMDWLQGNPKALLIIEIAGANEQQTQEKSQMILSHAQNKKMGYTQVILSAPSQMAKVWTLRKAGLGILLSKRTYSRAIAFLEDISVSPNRLADFMSRFCKYLERKGKSAGIYGHVGSGCMHIRPYIDLQDPKEFVLMRQMMRDIAVLLLEFDGSLSGEHGDGLIRSWLNPLMFGDQLMQAFKDLKTAFDPSHLLNPGKIIPLPPEFEELRTQPGQTLVEPTTFLNFKAEGGFALAADLCNGNGLCRKKENVMCPSFQATNEEFHSTRARAQTLRSIIHSRLPLKDFTSQGLHNVMDLCLSCKGCKTECPSQVDMAKMKSEFLFHFQEENGYSLRSRLFSSIGLINKWTVPFAALFNILSKLAWVKKGLERLGISSKRTLPPLSKKRFSDWFKAFPQPSHLKESVILFNDTFNEFNHPEVGQAAVYILNALGYKVIVPQWKCCGRPALTKGVLKQAREQAHTLLSQLGPLAMDGIPIIGLEPSCILTIKDDYSSLLPEEDPFFPLAETIIASCITLDEFLAQLVQKNQFHLPFNESKKKVKVHGHCHQKALVGMEPTLIVLKAIPGFEVTEIPSGCCGMAGSFGYELEHYAISMQIGELRLFPAIRESHPDTEIVANGMSCRHQIFDGTNRTAKHLAEIIYQHMIKS